jgi:DNA-binding NarL/FixJ family response regulator
VTRVAIADDQPLVRHGLRTILASQPDFEVVAEAADGRAAVSLVAEFDPDVLLLDVRMPTLDGIGVLGELARMRARTRVLVLTTFDLDEYVYETMRNGASGFLLKDAEPADLLGAVRAVARGDTLLGSTITRRLIERYVRMPSPGEPTDPRFGDLTEREREVLLLIAKGSSNAEIAAELFLSEATVKTHVTRILSKLDLRDRLQAVVLAYESGLITPGESQPSCH